MVYLITYDLNNPGQNYEDVIKAIKSASTGKWCSYWKSSWVIQSNYYSASGVFDLIKPYLDQGDKCLVIEVRNNKQGWLTQDQWNYLNGLF